ncbi:MAG: SDR family NAD(P)-dependent oxidoreductase [Parvibaculaceae bacterium]|nr:SDR family NAD(P)-dependent oxidoreductase [Parvibaculaceae bacterium]
MDLKLKGKKAIITGATRGIGRAIAETLADEGCDVAICARNEEQLVEAVAALKARGVEAQGEVVDIAQADQLKGFIEKMGKGWGQIDLLISNASALASGGDEAHFQSGFDIDLLGAQRSTEVALPYLKKAAAANGDASVIFIASVSAAEASEGNAYGALKAAMIHYAKGLARQYAGDHVRFNAVSPGTVYFKGGVWDFIEQHMEETFNDAMKKNLTGRMATPQDIADAAVFLSSPRSSFTTGINMVVDGAITSRVNF